MIKIHTFKSWSSAGHNGQFNWHQRVKCVAAMTFASVLETDDNRSVPHCPAISHHCPCFSYKIIHHVNLFTDWPSYILKVKYASSGVTVFIPCNTVLLYVPHSTVQVHTKPPYTHVYVYVCAHVHAYALTDVPTRTWTETNGHLHTHTHTSAWAHNHTSGHTHAPATSTQTHTYGTYNHAYKWKHTCKYTLKSCAHTCENTW
jgi:hypothetical protein